MNWQRYNKNKVSQITPQRKEDILNFHTRDDLYLAQQIAFQLENENDMDLVLPAIHRKIQIKKMISMQMNYISNKIF